MPIDFKDLVGFSKPATKLLTQVGNMVGTLYEPTRIRREAMAQADALLIRTNAEIVAEQLKERAANRFVAQELRKQENIEAVLVGAAGQVSESAGSPGDMDADWLNRFILEAQEVSDARLQHLWSTLLAGEFQTPGRFSRRVFRLLKELDPAEVAIIDDVASRVLTVTLADGEECRFLNVDIYEQWTLGTEHEKEHLGMTRVEWAPLLHELGLIEIKDFQFSFSVEGPMEPDKLHLSRLSAKAISCDDKRRIIPAYKQPAFIRTKWPSMEGDNWRMTNIWLKTVLFDAWKVTALGEQIFSLSQKEKNGQHFETVAGIVIKSGLQLDENTEKLCQVVPVTPPDA